MSKYELVVTEKKFKIGHSQSSFGFSCSFDHFQKGIEKSQMFFTNSFYIVYKLLIKQSLSKKCLVANDKNAFEYLS